MQVVPLDQQRTYYHRRQLLHRDAGHKDCESAPYSVDDRLGRERMRQSISGRGKDGKKLICFTN